MEGLQPPFSWDSCLPDDARPQPEGQAAHCRSNLQQGCCPPGTKIRERKACHRIEVQYECGYERCIPEAALDLT